MAVVAAFHRAVPDLVDTPWSAGGIVLNCSPSQTRFHIPKKEGGKKILHEVDDLVAIINMHRPDCLNALTNFALAEIKHALAQADKDECVVGVFATGAAGVFCAGMNMGVLDEASAVDRAESENLSYLDAKTGDPDDGD
jgi:1,4-dihydroxy-2-naphthoyl-CoA synthase